MKLLLCHQIAIGTELYATNKISNCYYTYCFVVVFALLRRMPQCPLLKHKTMKETLQRREVFFLSKNLCGHVYALIFYFLLLKHSVHKIFCDKIRITVSKPGEVFCREFIILLIRWYFCSQPINIAIDETKHGSH